MVFIIFLHFACFQSRSERRPRGRPGAASELHGQIRAPALTSQSIEKGKDTLIYSSYLIFFFNFNMLCHPTTMSFLYTALL